MKKTNGREGEEGWLSICTSRIRPVNCRRVDFRSCAYYGNVVYHDYVKYVLTQEEYALVFNLIGGRKVANVEIAGDLTEFLELGSVFQENFFPNWRTLMIVEEVWSCHSCTSMGAPGIT